MEATRAIQTVRRSGSATLAAVIEALRACAVEIAGPEASFATLEAITMAVSNEATRGTLSGELEARADCYGEAVRIGGTTYVEHEVGTVTYHSLCGPMDVRRSTYRDTGMHNGPTVVPLELEVGIVERATPALAKAVALGYAKHELRSYAEDLDAAHREPPSRATMERMARSVAEHAHAEAPRIERQLRRSEKLPEGARGVVLGLDRGSVPMAEQRSAEQAPATRRRERTEPYVRTPPTPFDVNWRMAPVATVAITDAQGEALETRRYAATPADGWDGIIARAMADVRDALRRDSTLNVGVVQDGAHELWNVTRAALAKEPTVTSYVEAIDRYHLSERLGEVLQIIEPDSNARATTNERWQCDLDDYEHAIDWIEIEICRAQQGLTPTAATALDGHITYIRNNKDRMQYAALIKRGLPVGSGTTESACNTLLNLRVKRNAEHWSEPGLRGVVTLRAIHQSRRFHPFWRLLARDYMDHVTPVFRAA